MVQNGKIYKYLQSKAPLLLVKKESLKHIMAEESQMRTKRTGLDENMV